MVEYIVNILIISYISLSINIFVDVTMYNWAHVHIAGKLSACLWCKPIVWLWSTRRSFLDMLNP